MNNKPDTARGGYGSRSGRFPARQRFKFLQDIYLEQHRTDQILKAARHLHAGEQLADKAAERIRMENLREQVQMLDRELEILRRELEAARRENQTLKQSIGFEAAKVSPPPTDLSADAGASTLVPEPSAKEESSSEEFSGSAVPVREEDAFLISLMQDFQEWNMVGEVLGETQPPQEAFQSFTEYEMFRQLMRRTPLKLLICDLEGNILGASTKYLRACGKDLAEVRQHKISEIFGENGMSSRILTPEDSSLEAVQDHFLNRTVYLHKRPLVLQDETCALLLSCHPQD